MKALCWYGKEDVRVEQVPDPKILNPRDAIVRITSTAICGSDLHLYGGFIPGMMPGDILGHEFMGEVVEVGSEVRNLKRGDRVVVPFSIACGRCWYCKNDLPSLCDNSNPNAEIAEAAYGQSPGGFFGYSHAFGGYAGGQAEYARVPFADAGPLKIEDGMSDDQALFLSDILPTGWMAAANGDVKKGDVVAIWGAGPVGQMAIVSAKLMGAERIIAIDRVPERLEMARRDGGAEPMNFEQVGDVVEALKLETGGRGPDVCIDCVGMEAHGRGRADRVYDKVMHTVRLESDRPSVLREMIQASRKHGRISIAGVYSGFVDRIPMGAAFNKALTFKMGQAPVQAYMRPLFDKIKNGDIDPTFVVTHRIGLEDAPQAYRMFRDKLDGCVKVILKPQDHKA